MRTSSRRHDLRTQLGKGEAGDTHDRDLAMAQHAHDLRAENGTCTCDLAEGITIEELFHRVKTRPVSRPPIGMFNIESAARQAHAHH